ncbi:MULTISPECIES: hypothetical protein [unclassified Streptomyces]|uniref:hypothetical protein n=1 Tax=unclassified Streptomyces TaxID=2593676 RepID=UPI0036E791CC
MAYDLKAVIAEAESLRRAARDLPAARTASLGQGLALMPLTHALFESVAHGGGGGALGFSRLPEPLAKTVAAWSAGGPVAYVEAEYFGGVGEQRAVVWDGGTVVLGPLRAEEGEPFPPDGGPVSRALRRLGVVAGPGEDEFSAVGLERHRHGGAWIA